MKVNGRKDVHKMTTIARDSHEFLESLQNEYKARKHDFLNLKVHVSACKCTTARRLSGLLNNTERSFIVIPKHKVPAFALEHPMEANR